MKLSYLAFSKKGYELAKTLAKALGGQAFRSGHADENGKVLTLKEWTETHFSTCDGIVFVGAAGIAIRAIAPFVKDKKTDPAVIVIDDMALHVIPLLSGHLGGANDLARHIAEITGGDPVITTATDIGGVFAVDEWSKHQNCELLEPKLIAGISGSLLRGENVSVYSRWAIEGDVPENIRLTDSPAAADIVLDIRNAAGSGRPERAKRPLHLVPKICTLGVGCRKGILADTMDKQFSKCIAEAGIFAESISRVATIDLKKEETGLLEFCKSHGWPLTAYSSEELGNVAGAFTASRFVSSVTGVDNVCERSAVLASGGPLLKGKTAGSGVTMALAVSDYTPDWTWTRSLE